MSQEVQSLALARIVATPVGTAFAGLGVARLVAPSNPGTYASGLGVARIVAPDPPPTPFAGDQRPAGAAIAVHDSRVCTATLQPVGTGSLDSAYTEADPEPGTAISDTAASLLTPEISGAQTQDVTITVDRPGLVDLETGATFMCTVQGQERGWDSPVTALHWEAIAWSTITPFIRSTEIATHPRSGDPYVVSGRDGAETELRRWDATTEAWGLVALLPEGGYDRPIAMAFRDDGLLAILHDKGANQFEMFLWDGSVLSEAYQATGLTGVGSGGRARMEWMGDSTLALVLGSISGGVTQYASDSMGSAWDEVASAPALAAAQPDLVKMANGSLLLVYVRTLPSVELHARLIPSERDSFVDAAEIVLSATFWDNSCAWVDPSGAAYIVAASALGAASSATAIWASYDGGVTWDRSAFNVLDAGIASNYPTRMSASAVAGGAVLIGGHATVVATNGDSLWALWLGGWSNRKASYAQGLKPIDRHGYGGNSGSGFTYLPWDKPGDLGVTMIGAGSDSVATLGFLRIDTVANQRHPQFDLGASSQYEVCVAMRLVSGGSSFALNTGIAIRLANGSAEVELRAHIDATGITFRDVHAAVDIGVHSADMTQLHEIRIGVSLGGYAIAYVRPYGPRKLWSQVNFGGATLADKGGAYNLTGQLRWGNVAVATAASEWKWAYHVTSIVGTLYDGCPFPPLPQPIPHIGDDGTEIAYLRAVGGPALLGSYELPAEHAYSVDHTCIREHRSLAEGWRQTGTTEALLVYRLATDDVWLSRSLVFGLVGCNFRQAFLERWDGAAWQPIVELDLGELSGRTYEATGRTIYPASGGGTATRYLWRGELVGGHAVISGSAYSIEANGAGPWNEGSEDTVRPFVRVDTAPPSTGTVDLVWPDGCAVYHAATPVIASGGYIRIRIPGGQACPDAGYACSGVLIGELRPFGADSDWGWVDERPTRVDLDEDPRGVLRVRERGPIGASWSLDWTSPLNHRQIRKNANLPFLGVSETDGNRAGFDDVFEFMHGVIAESVSGELPVVALHRMPESGETVTDRSLWLPGTLQATARFESVSGDERGTDEVGRVPSIVIRRLV